MAEVNAEGYDMRMTMTILFLLLIVATPAMAVHRSFSGGYPSSAAWARGMKVQGLNVGEGAMMPMEARLEGIAAQNAASCADKAAW